MWIFLLVFSSCISQPSVPAPKALRPRRGDTEVSAPLLTAQTKLKASDLTADLGDLERAYRTLHPGLLRYNTQAQLDARFAQARHEFSQDRTLGDAFRILTELTASIACGHSYPNPSNQAKDIAAALFRGNRLPFLFRWIENQIVVTRNLTTHAELGPGTTIETIDAVTTKDMLAALLPLARADGHNDAKRRSYLEVLGENNHEPFDILAALLYPAMFAKSSVQLTLRAASGQRSQLTVALQTFAARDAALQSMNAAPAANAPLWHADLLPHNRQIVAYLAMPTWVAYKTKWDWKADLANLMERLIKQNIAGLVLDLRGNEGGNDVGDEILVHLIERPLQRAAMVRRVRFKTVPTALRPLLDTWDASFFELGKDAQPIGGDWREFSAANDDELIMPRGPRYRGKLVVITDAANSSATFQFALTVQQNHLGTLVGSPTGGSQRGINGGAFFFVRLPRTRLEVDLPLIGTFPLSDAPDAGVEPDIRVDLTAQDFAAGRDPQREAALSAAARE